MPKKLFTSILTFITIAVLAFSSAQSGNNNTRELIINEWILLGPFSTPLPAMYEEFDTNSAIEGLVKFQEFELSSIKPKGKQTFTWHDGSPAQWVPVKAGPEGLRLNGDAHNPSIAYLSFFVKVKRWTQATLTLKTSQALRVCMDGRAIATKTKIDVAENEQPVNSGEPLTADVRLETGTHWILIKTVFDPDSKSSWTIKGSLKFDRKYTSPPLEITTNSEETMTISHLLDGPKVTGTSISPDGTLAAMTLRQSIPPSDASETWVELYDLNDYKRLRTFRGGDALSRVNWAPDGKKFSYTTYDQTKGTIWVVDLEAGSTVPLIKSLSNLGSHQWSPDGSFILYSVTEKGKEDRPGVKRLKNLADRQPFWRDRSYLYRVTLPDGARQRLTTGQMSTNMSGFSPDGKKLLFSRNKIDYTQRPFAKTELYALDLTTINAELLWEGFWFNDAQWTPDGERLLMLGGPSMFGDIGTKVPEDVLPNEYDGQAYLFDPDSKEVQAITRDFNPSISQAAWCEPENCLFFVATERSFVNLFRYDPKKGMYSRVTTGAEVISGFDVAKRIPKAVFIGSSVADPPRVFVADLTQNLSRVILDPGANDYANVRFGQVERWTFTKRDGTEIEGRIYYPPDFDPEKKYPCIVNYYGGVFPVTRGFGGRYPLNLYAAHGYIVYVLQPSGAVGFGQKFSARHVNDWGLVAANDIIEGVEKFLAAHSFVDPERVGCIGASYGGFMTMFLQTQTRAFATAIAHAGISSISSYWGEGYWGYAYSAVATANSFPWNRKDLYVNQSPLFNADKISTPLLLLHGSVDTNVPPGESTQLYTALKLLGREVEYIQITDQNHHILTYNKRILWTHTILAWFDRWLKKQPEWWRDLYPNN